MSNEIVTPSVSDTSDAGATTEVASGGEATEAPVLPVQDYANYMVPVKVDGEELSVPLSEAISGYQRQADYTRKTQELSQQRQEIEFAAAIQSALERNPEATIDLLARHYGISRAQAQQMADESQQELESLDPTERKLREMESKVSAFEEYRSQQEIEREISRLQSQYSDFNVAEVVNTALRLGSTDLEGTYKQLMFDKMMSRQQLESEAKKKQQETEAAVVAAKRQAAVVSGGSNPSASATTESVEAITSIRDAWAAAKRQLGAN
jgi:hypothetical protein